ncbi:tudor domain-containing protein 7-like isoform X2 [Ruditapes philippinarum]|uniref:tudor domain-containing protein 7-like isoform X2 n=1 Tax=Ruditapes philippinarum TaxID=129788 RepID=UPI00295C0967|nr:tudor domain-containing protein 7-like isoform X2 [Ruditapes philippinarum]
MEEEEIKKVKSLLRSVLIGVKEGVLATRLQKEYKEIVGENIPYLKMGFPSFEKFILSMPDVARIDRRGGDIMIKAVADKSTSHIQALVSKQRSKRVNKPVRRPRGGGGSRFLPPRGSSQYRPPRTPIHHMPRTTLPSFVSPPFQQSLTPVTISVGSGNRTIRVGANPMFNKAMSEANNDRIINRPGQQASRFEVPPRFRKRIGGASPPQQQQQQHQSTPIRRPQQSKLPPAAMLEGGDYMKVLMNYFQEMNETLEFYTTPAAGGYVSLVKINKETYGSEDIYRSAAEAEAAAAKNAVLHLNLHQKQQDTSLQPIDWNESAKEETVGTSLSREQLAKVKSRVKEMLEKKKNGLWGTRIPHEYKEKYNEDPPAELMKLVKSWRDIAKVEAVPNTDRELVYPVIEDPNMVNGSENQEKQNTPDNSAVKAENKSALESPCKSEVKDLYGLYVETKDKQNSVLKNLEIPKDLQISSNDPVTVYMTFIYNPGYFCVQREDSIIDTIAEQLQTHCQSTSSPPSKDLEKGRYCAALFSGDGAWTRAQILQHRPDGTVELLFVDYGNVESVKEDDIRWLSPELAKYPCQAISCSLYGIQPLQGESEWGETASTLFADEVQEQALIAIPQSACDDMLEVVIYLKSDEKLSINEKLIQAGVVMATKADEDSLHPVDLKLPEDKEWDVHVTYISSSTESVMLRLVGENYSDKLDSYQSKLQEAFRNSSPETPITEGHTYIAYDDGLYHRVRVMSVQDGKKIQCYFLDHGDTDELIPEQLHPIDPQINKMLPYQAVEVCLYGLEEVSTNITALEKICDIALGKTCVAEVVDREGRPSVILYDTSEDNDININDTILRTIEAEGGGIGTPRTESPSPANSASSTPQRVLSPLPRPVDTTEDSIPVKKLDTNSNPVIQTNQTNGFTSSVSSQQVSPNVSQSSELSQNSDASVNSDISMKSKSSEFLDNSQNVSRPILGRSPGGQKNSNDNESVPRPFQIPEVGEYLDVHVAFVHDPSNFVCIPYNEMAKLNTLLLDMRAYYSVQTATMTESEIEIGKVYSGHKDGIWYRAKVCSIVGTDLVSVYLADLGEYTVMMISELQPLVPQFCKLPLMAFNATLGSIMPESGDWFEAAKYKFIELARERDLIALIQGKDESTGAVVDCRLIDTSNENEDICIDEVLVTLQYAKLK